ncbi:MAG: ABC transporter permease [Candidatus Bathyarchaeota archaeon]|nr:ABC transporter permease [Candidatus Bathyarchaeota archaeon]
MRTLLCILGVALATTFVIAVGATTMRYTTVIKEMNVLFSGQVMVVSKDTIVIQAIPITRGFLPPHLLETINGIDKVEKAVPILFITSITLEGIINPVPPNFTFGIPLENWQMLLGPTPLVKGRHFPTNESSNEVVVGPSLAEQYNLAVGSKMEVNGYELNVTGILDTRLAILTRSIIMPLKLAQTIYYPGRINIITAKPVQGCSQKDLADEIERQVESVNVLTEDERNDMIQPILAQVEMWTVGIQTIVFLMSLILVMTVTLMSVSERRRDFATLDAIGAPLSYVFRAVVFEAMLMGVLGGILGIAFGSFSAIVLASLYTNIPLQQFFPSLFDVVPPVYMIEIFSAIVLVCCFGGILPAINAIRMRIAEVLRAEY